MNLDYIVAHAQMWTKRQTPGEGALVLPPHQANWLEATLDAAHVTYTSTETTLADADAHLMALNGWPKRTRDAYDGRPVIAFTLPFDQDSCTQIMKDLLVSPIETLYVHAVIGDLNMPSPLVCELAGAPTTDEAAWLAFPGCYGTTLANELSQAAINIESVDANNVPSEIRERLYRILIAPRPRELREWIDKNDLTFMRIHRPQSICDDVMTSMLTAPFLPETLLDEADAIAIVPINEPETTEVSDPIDQWWDQAEAASLE